MTDAKNPAPSAYGTGATQTDAVKPSNFNLPNVLTSLRILLVPVLAVLILRSRGVDTGLLWWSFGLFVALMITDKLDGDIARKRNLVTDFGKIADPIADKALMTVSLVCLNLIGFLPWWITIVIMIREFGITFWRMGQLKQGRVVPASKGGKIKTTLQAVAVGMYLMPLPAWLNAVTTGVMLAAVVVTVWTGIQYLVDSKKAN